jgi:hypothetical protein
MVPQISLFGRIECLPKGSEEKTLREIVINLLGLDLTTLRTLCFLGNEDDYRKFQSLNEDLIIKIEHDARLERFPEDMQIRRYVRMLPSTTLRPIVSRPLNTDYYQEAFYLRIAAYRELKEEEDFATRYEGYRGPESFDLKELRHMVKLSQGLYNQVKDATQSGYLEPELDRVRILLQSIDEHIQDACNEMGVQYQPMVISRTTDQRYFCPPIPPPSRLKSLQLTRKQTNARQLLCNATEG